MFCLLAVWALPMTFGFGLYELLGAVLDGCFGDFVTLLGFGVVELVVILLVACGWRCSLQFLRICI